MIVKSLAWWAHAAYGSPVPAAADTYDLGSTALEWRSVYVGDVGGVYLGLDQDVRLYSGLANRFDVDLGGGNALQFSSGLLAFQAATLITSPAAADITLRPGTTGSVYVQDQQDVASAQVAVFEGDRAFPTDNDEAYITMRLSSDTGVQTEVARLTWKATDVSNGTMDGQFLISVISAGSLLTMFQIDSTVAGVITTTIPTGDIILNDNVSIRFGSAGAESDVESNGSNTIWTMTNGMLQLTSALLATTAVMQVTNTVDNASVLVAIFEGNRAGFTDGDAAYISLRLSDNAGNQDEQARISWEATTVLSGATQDGDLILSALVNNVLTEFIRLDGSVPQITFGVAVSGGAGTFTSLISPILTGTSGASSLTLAGYVTGGVAAQNDIVFRTGNAVNPQALATRLTLGSNAATAVATWASITHSGVVFSGDADFNDNVNLRLGTSGGEGTIASDGTDVVWSISNGHVRWTKSGIGATPTIGMNLNNSTAAAAGAQQYSPAFNFRGRGWRTDAVAESQSVDAQIYIVPVQGAANPTAYLTFDTSINAGAYTSRLTLSSVGNLGIGVAGTGFGTNAAKVLGIASGTAPSTAPVDLVQLWAADYAIGDARLYLRTEAGDNLILGNNSVSTSANNLTLATVAGGDVLLGDDATLLYVDGGVNGGVGGVGIGQVAANGVMLVAGWSSYTMAAGTTAARHFNTQGNVTELINATITDIVGAYFNTFTVTDGGGTETVGILSTVYIVGAPTAGSTPANGPYALFVDAGATRLDGTLTASGGGALTGTWTDLGSVTTIDINGGTIDGVVIGGGVAGAITGTTIDATTDFTIGGTVITDGVITDTGVFVLTPTSAVSLGSGEAGTVAATGMTIRAPNITTGGAGNVAGADLIIAAGLGTGTGDVGTIIFSLPIVAGAGDFIQTTATRMTLDMVGSATDLTVSFAQATTISSTGAITIKGVGASSVIIQGDLTQSTQGDVVFKTSNVADANGTTRLTIGSNAATAVATWVAITHTGVVFSGNATLNDSVKLLLGTGVDAELYYDGTNLVLNPRAVGTGYVQALVSAIGATPADAIALWNATDAAAGAQQYSPALRFHGEGWKTDAVAESQNVDWRVYAQPVEGAANPTVNLLFQSSVNDAAFATRLTIGSDGTLTPGLDISLGANKLKTTDLILKQDTSTRFGVKNAADNAYLGLILKQLVVVDQIVGNTTGTFFDANNNDAATLIGRARDTGVGSVEIWRMAGAADPYFQVGRDDTGVALNAVTDMLVLQAGGGTGNEAANFGLGISVKLGNAASQVEERGSLDWVLVTATDGAEVSRLDVGLMNAGAMANRLQYSAGVFAFQEATNITTTSGALTITPLSGQSLNIVLGTTGDLVVNTSQFVVDTSEARVGFGTASPAQKLHMVNGHTRMDQVAAPGAATVAVNVAAGNLNGAYYYRISYVTALGETETGPVSAVVNPANEQVDLSAIPTSADSAVTSRKIYRTTAGGSTTLMKLVTTIADNSTTTYTDNIADGSLGVAESRVNTTGGVFWLGTIRRGFADFSATAWGSEALRVNTGYYNSAFGRSALYSNTTGYYNSAFGQDALNANTTGYNNSVFGGNAAVANTTGYENSVLGASALAQNTTGYSNSAFGRNAGRFITGGATSNETSNTSLYIGAGTRAKASGDANEIVIGYLVTGLGSNSVNLGNDSVTLTGLHGVVSLGIGEAGTTVATGNTLRAPNIATGGAGNIAGADLTIAAGLGTGTGDAGTIIFSLPIVAGAGDFIQTTATRLTLDMAGSTTLLSMVIAQDMTITGGNLLLGGTLGLTGTRVSNIFTTSQTTTNAETVDSWGMTKQHITPYDDALAVLRGISVVAYEHKSVYDPSGRRKLGVLAESVGERMVTPFDEYVGLGQGPRLDMLGLAAINTRAIQQVDNEVEMLRQRVATLERELATLRVGD